MDIGGGPHEAIKIHLLRDNDRVLSITAPILYPNQRVARLGERCVAVLPAVETDSVRTYLTAFYVFTAEYLTHLY